MKLKQKFAARVAEQEAAAMKRYHERYDNTVRMDATDYAVSSGQHRRVNKLLDDAMALCGSPWYKLSHIRWNEQELAFLMLFVDEDTQVAAWDRAPGECLARSGFKH